MNNYQNSKYYSKPLNKTSRNAWPTSWTSPPPPPPPLPPKLQTAAKPPPPTTPYPGETSDQLTQSPSRRSLPIQTKTSQGSLQSPPSSQGKANLPYSPQNSHSSLQSPQGSQVRANHGSQSSQSSHRSPQSSQVKANMSYSSQNPQVAQRYSENSPTSQRYSENSSRYAQSSSRYSEGSPRYSETSPRYSKNSPRTSYSSQSLRNSENSPQDSKSSAYYSSYGSRLSQNSTYSTQNSPYSSRNNQNSPHEIKPLMPNPKPNQTVSYTSQSQDKDPKFVIPAFNSSKPPPPLANTQKTIHIRIQQINGIQNRFQNTNLPQNNLPQINNKNSADMSQPEQARLQQQVLAHQQNQLAKMGYNMHPYYALPGVQAYSHLQQSVLQRRYSMLPQNQLPPAQNSQPHGKIYNSHQKYHFSTNKNLKRQNTEEPESLNDYLKVRKKKKKSLSQNIPVKRDWTMEDAAKALNVEKDYNKRNKHNSLIIKFPDLELNREIVSKFHTGIDSVHFQQPSTPRFCFVLLKEDVDPEKVMEELNKTKFGDGFLSAEFKRDREDDIHIGPEDIDPLTLYVGNLAQEVTKKDVVQSYPKQHRIDIGFAKRMKYTRYAFVTFKNVDDSIEAFKKTHATQMYSKSLIVRFRRLHGTVGLPGEAKPQGKPNNKTNGELIPNIVKPEPGSEDDDDEYESELYPGNIDEAFAFALRPKIKMEVKKEEMCSEEEEEDHEENDNEYYSEFNFNDNIVHKRNEFSNFIENETRNLTENSQDIDRNVEKAVGEIEHIEKLFNSDENILEENISQETNLEETILEKKISEVSPGSSSVQDSNYTIGDINCTVADNRSVKDDLKCTVARNSEENVQLNLSEEVVVKTENTDSPPGSPVPDLTNMANLFIPKLTVKEEFLETVPKKEEPSETEDDSSDSEGEEGGLNFGSLINGLSSKNTELANLQKHVP